MCDIINSHLAIMDLTVLFLNRSSQTIFSGWWYTVDRISVFVICVLVCLGIIACATASPPVALRIGADAFFFVKKHFAHVAIALTTMFSLSLLSPKQIKLATIPCILFLTIIMILTPIYGVEIKGAKRWIVVFGMHMQPSEFLRPWLVVTTAWLLDIAYITSNGIYYAFAMGLYVLLTLCILAQPDVGMTVMLAAVWVSQIFVSRLNTMWIICVGAFLVLCCGASYLIFPHVQQRLHGFMHSGGAENYQITKSIDAFNNGGVFGMGPGQGTTKNYIPDSHSDFVFSVIGEEFGLLVCVVIMLLYCFVAINSILRSMSQGHVFSISATTGLAIQLQMQVIINIGVVTRLLPTTGVTMPLISYGGSSMIATGMTLGLMLALTRYANHETLRLPRIQSWHTLGSSPPAIYNQ